MGHSSSYTAELVGFPFEVPSVPNYPLYSKALSLPWKLLNCTTIGPLAVLGPLSLGTGVPSPKFLSFLSSPNLYNTLQFFLLVSRLCNFQRSNFSPQPQEACQRVFPANCHISFIHKPYRLYWLDVFFFFTLLYVL